MSGVLKVEDGATGEEEDSRLVRDECLVVTTIPVDAVEDFIVEDEVVGSEDACCNLSTLSHIAPV